MAFEVDNPIICPLYFLCLVRVVSLNFTGTKPSVLPEFHGEFRHINPLLQNMKNKKLCVRDSC